jgi:BlaI family penicillinase repressor
MNKSITDAELEVMQVLWREKRAMTLAELRAELETVKTRNKSTIQTLVLRLRDKGVIEPLDRYGAARYVPIVTEEEYISAEVPTFLARVFEGNAKALVAALCKDGQLRESDIDELKEYFRVGGDTHE